MQHAMYSPQAGIDGGVQLQAAGLGLSHSQEWAGATPIAPHPPSNLPTLTAEKQEPEPVRKQLGPTRRVKVALKASLSSPGPRFPLLITSLSSRVTTSSNEPLSTFLTFRPVPFALSPYLLFVKTLFSVHASGEKTACFITRRASVPVPFALACVLVLALSQPLSLSAVVPLISSVICVAFFFLSAVAPCHCGIPSSFFVRLLCPIFFVVVPFKFRSVRLRASCNLLLFHHSDFYFWTFIYSFNSPLS